MMTEVEYGALSAIVRGLPELLHGGRCVEVGAGVGGSTAIIAQALKLSKNNAMLHTIDNLTMNVGRVQKLTDGKYKTQRDAIENRVKEFDNVRLHEMSSEEAFALLGLFDLKFCLIDGDHRYESAMDDFRMWSTRITAGGLLVAHDVGKSVTTWGMGPTAAYVKWMMNSPGWRVVGQFQSLIALQRGWNDWPVL